MKNIVCLISGRGSNLQSLLATAREEDWARAVPARVVAVIANRPDAAGLVIARDAGVPAVMVDHRDYASREAFDTALAQAIDCFAPDLVVLAGFMRVLTDEFVARYRGRLINVHPSLLPAFPGLATHRQALAAGVRVHGATVHFVSREVDGGPIVGQAVVPVRPGDTEAELAARVLEQEHVLLPRSVRAVVQGRVTLVEGRVRCTDEVAEWLRIGLQVGLRVGP